MSSKTIDIINNFKPIPMSKKALEELEDRIKNPEKYQHPAACHCKNCRVIRKALNIEFKT